MGHGGGYQGYAGERAALVERGRPGTPVPGRYGPGNSCLHVTVALLVLCALAAGGIAWSWHRARNPPAPDVAATAGSPAEQAADRAAARAMDGQLDRLRAATPWAQPLGTSVTDFCSATLNSAFMSVTRHWGPADCARETTLYVAFDGDLHERLRQLDTAIGALPWRPENPSVANPDPLRGLYFSRSVRPGPGTDAPATLVPPQPVALAVSFSPLPPQPATPGAPPVTPPGGGTAAPGATPAPATMRLQGLRVSVTSSPALPEGGAWDEEWALDHGPSDRPFGQDGESRAVYHLWRPLSRTALAATGYAHHRYLATFVLSAFSSSDPGRSRG